MNASALETTLAALNLGDDDEALVTLARQLAQAVDKDSGNASLCREYRSVVLALMSKAGGSGDVDDDTASFLVSISTPVRAALGHSSES